MEKKVAEVEVNETVIEEKKDFILVRGAKKAANWVKEHPVKTVVTAAGAVASVVVIAGLAAKSQRELAVDGAYLDDDGMLVDVETGEIREPVAEDFKQE